MKLKMKLKMKKGVFVLLMLWMLLLVNVNVNAKAREEEEPRRPAVPSPNSHWDEVRKVLSRGLTYLFPPKIDFRAGKAVEDGNGKEAITKSFEKTKQMVEDSAKAAAQTLHPEL